MEAEAVRQAVAKSCAEQRKLRALDAKAEKALKAGIRRSLQQKRKDERTYDKRLAMVDQIALEADEKALKAGMRMSLQQKRKDERQHDKRLAMVDQIFLEAGSLLIMLQSNNLKGLVMEFLGKTDDLDMEKALMPCVHFLRPHVPPWMSETWGSIWHATDGNEAMVLLLMQPTTAVDLNSMD